MTVRILGLILTALVVLTNSARPAEFIEGNERTNLGRCPLPAAAGEFKFPQLTGAYPVAKK